MPFARYTPRISIALLAAATLAGCAGNGKGLDANGNPITPGGGGTVALTADFQAIQENVFTPICTKCHSGTGAPEGLQLDADHSYSLLVGVPSNEQPAVLRVAAGDPDSSYLIRKLEGIASISGGQMPLGGPYLPQSTIDVIKQWIIDGAQKPATTMSTAAVRRALRPFAIASTSPEDHSIVSSAVAQIVVACTGDVDSLLLFDNTTVRLDRLDVSSTPGAARPVPIAASVPVGNPTAILIKPATPLITGTYRVTLQGSLANQSAQPLGDDYSFTFAVGVLQ